MKLSVDIDSCNNRLHYVYVYFDARVRYHRLIAAIINKFDRRGRYYRELIVAIVNRNIDKLL